MSALVQKNELFRVVLAFALCVTMAGAQGTSWRDAGQPATVVGSSPIVGIPENVGTTATAAIIASDAPVASGLSSTDGEALSGLYQFTLNDIDGKPLALSQYQGKVLLLVNVASHCGFTGQYAGLQKLYETYSKQGLVILGFPANDFLGQEPGTEAEIKGFCSLTYGVTFPMFSKISVIGEAQHPLYKYLTEPATNPDFPGAITWNFNKFLVSRSGKILGRFGSKVTPEAPELVAGIEKAIAEK